MSVFADNVDTMQTYSSIILDKGRDLVPTCESANEKTVNVAGTGFQVIESVCAYGGCGCSDRVAFEGANVAPRSAAKGSHKSCTSARWGYNRSNLAARLQSLRLLR
jgi:hypothetical protein